MALYVVLSIALLSVVRAMGANVAYLGSTRAIAETDARFLSVAIDSNVMGEKWKNFDFTSKRVLNMAAALSPAFLRIGGTAADLVKFKGVERKYHDSEKSDVDLCHCSTNKLEEYVCEKPRRNITMTESDWIKMNEFCRAVGWNLLFDLNVLLRKDNGTKWDESNARSLLKFSTAMKYENIMWELGNEPNALQHSLGFKLPAKRLGKDFYRLRRLLNQFKLYKDSLLVGPDVSGVRRCDMSFEKSCKPLKYLQQVLSASSGVLDAVTWHQYYLNGRTATLENFTNPSVFNKLDSEMRLVRKYLYSSGVTKPVWLGETASAFGGGAHELSNRFVSGFLWLNKLGTAARNGHRVVIRQSFYHGCYALLGEDLMPNPDFWVSVIFKTVVGTKVLDLRVRDVLNGTIRLFAHCAKGFDGGVVLYGMNIGQYVNIVKLKKPLDQSPTIHNYELATLDGNLQSRNLALNGRNLELIGNTTLPDLRPRVQENQSQLVLKPYTMNFWVFPDASLKACF